jgi:hypothetical protein
VILCTIHVQSMEGSGSIAFVPALGKHFRLKEILEISAHLSRYHVLLEVLESIGVYIVDGAGKSRLNAEPLRCRSRINFVPKLRGGRI